MAQNKQNLTFSLEERINNKIMKIGITIIMLENEGRGIF